MLLWENNFKAMIWSSNYDMIISKIIIIIIIYFKNVYFFHAQLGLDVCLNMKSLHIFLNTAQGANQAHPCYFLQVLSKSSCPCPYLLHPYVPARQLRSSGENKLVVPFTRIEAASKSFSVAAPTVFNKLPEDVRNCDTASNFRLKLKTFLFDRAYKI